MDQSSEAFLERFHTLEPAATPRSLGWGRTAQGQSSYEVLVSALAPDMPEPTILDLGAGDGHLLGQLGARFCRAQLFGVDLCEADLDRARRDPVLQRADLRCERAQALSFATGSMDFVVCHMALMLMNDLDLVVGEIARVCKPSGHFVAVVPNDEIRNLVLDEFMASFAEVAASDAETRKVALGDSRAFDAAELREVFTRVAPERAWIATPFVLGLAGSFERVWSSLALSYLPPMLSAAGQRELRRRFEAKARALADATGVIPFELALWLIEWRPAVR